MGTLDRSGAPCIHVRVDLQSGNAMDFVIDELTFHYLENLLQQGLANETVCRTWLGSSIPFDRALAIHVVGHRSNGSAIDLCIDCDGRPATDSRRSNRESRNL